MDRSDEDSPVVACSNSFQRESNIPNETIVTGKTQFATRLSR